jgi:hypothetical protein
MLEKAIPNNCNLVPCPPKPQAVLEINEVHEEIGSRKPNLSHGFAPH